MLGLDLAAALDPALVMKAAGLTPDPWQAQLLRADSNRDLLLCTRQAGKSTTTAALATYTAIYHAPALVLLLSPALRQSQELFKKVMTFYHSQPARVPVAEESALRLSLVNGSRIIALPGSEATIRGYSAVSLLIVDEASRVEDALYYAVRPMLAVSGGRLVALTTPFGKRGWFHEEWANGGNDWQRYSITAHDCPRIAPSFLDEERRRLGDFWFSQEYLCEFRETTDQVFSYDLVQAALSPDVMPLFG